MEANQLVLMVRSLGPVLMEVLQPRKMEGSQSVRMEASQPVQMVGSLRPVLMEALLVVEEVEEVGEAAQGQSVSAVMGQHLSNLALVANLCAMLRHNAISNLGHHFKDKAFNLIGQMFMIGILLLLVIVN